MKVFLDPGHGGLDRGGPGLVDEATTNLAIAHSVRLLLQSVPGVEVRMSRTDDRAVSMDARTDAANAWKADCLLSIHNNSMGGSGSACGTETFVQKFNDRSYSLGAFIQKGVHAVVKRNDRGVLTRDFESGKIHRYVDDNVRGELNYYHMLRRADVTSIIVECAFMDNPEDAELLKQPVVLSRIAQAIADAVVEWGRVRGLLPVQPVDTQFQTEVRESLDKLVATGAVNSPDIKAIDLDRLAVILNRLSLLDKPLTTKQKG